MISISINGVANIKKILANLQGINRFVEAWMKSGEVDKIMSDSFDKNFRSQGRPKWEALSQETIEDRIKKGFGSSPILTRTGNLRDEVVTLKGQLFSSIKVSTMQWGINQLRPSERNKFASHQLGKGKNGQSVPSRQMIGFQPEDAKKLKTSMAKFIFNLIG